MKILWLFHFKLHNNYDHFLNIDFAHYMSCYPGIELKGYGLDLTEHLPHLAPYRYDPRILLEDIYKHFAFDVILVNTKGRCFDYYNPHLREDKGSWLPKDFATWTKTPKIMMEEDYHYEIDDSWYKELNFDLILQRHYSQYLREENVPMKFFPFSVDTSTFNPWKNEAIFKNKIVALPSNCKRHKKIAFTGHDGDRAYIFRQTAIKRIVLANLGVNLSSSEPMQNKKLDGEYIKVLREYLAYVSCGSIYEICAAKNLEIISTGGILLTNKFLGIDLLFPENCYVAYDNELTDVVEKAHLIIDDPDYAKDVVKNGRQWVNTHHTHDIRIKELLKIIGDMK